MVEDAKFTGIVYYHGVGEQSRYESLGLLIQSFENFIRIQDSDFEYKVALEISNQTKKRVSYIEVKHNGKKFRFYEVYWAPITAGGTSGWGVFLWMLKQLTTPFGILNSPWNSRQRMRRSYLYTLWEKRYPKAVYRPNRDNSQLLTNLLDYYNCFCGDENEKCSQEESAQNRNKEGSFKEFINYLNDKQAGDDLVNFSHDWHASIKRSERLNLVVLITMGYALIVVPLILLYPLVSTLWKNAAEGHLFPKDPQHLLLYLLVLVIVLVGYVINKVLRYLGGDVQFWATYQETNEKYGKRKEILQLGRDTLSHVLSHDDCHRVIVMGHSLGTPISMDSLLSIGRSMRVEGADAPPTENIEAYITLASPIDKIHYLFESRRGTSRHFESIVDSVRGDIGTSPSPFVKDSGKYNFKWYNFWDKNDYISGPLFTPFPKNPRQVEDNTDFYLPQIYNLPSHNYDFPAPGRAHLGYFRHHNVIEFLYKIIFDAPEPSARVVESVRHSRSLRDYMENFLVLEDEKEKNLVSSLYTSLADIIRLLLPDFLSSKTNGLRDVTLLGTWSLLWSIVANMLNRFIDWHIGEWDVLEWIALYFTVMFMLIMGSLFLLAVLSFRKGHRNPFRKSDAPS